MRERLNGADGMNTPQKTPHPFQHLGPIEFRGAPAAAREDRESEIAEFVQGFVVRDQRRHHRDFALVECLYKGMLLEDLRIRPAPRAIKLHHSWRSFLDADLVNAVLVAVH